MGSYPDVQSRHGHSEEASTDARGNGTPDGHTNEAERSCDELGPVRVYAGKVDNPASQIGDESLPQGGNASCSSSGRVENRAIAFTTRRP